MVLTTNFPYTDEKKVDAFAFVGKESSPRTIKGNKFKKMVEEDPQMRVIPITIEDLLKKDYGNALPAIIAEMINKKPH